MNVLINEQLAKIAINKSLLKEYSNSSNDRIVYLNDNTEFQIQIYNPYSYPIGVEFSFNGSSSDNLLYVRPGQRIWLDRYLTEQKKFKFTTYEVEDTKTNEYAIKNNGEIIVKFYKEKEKQQIYYINNINTYDYGYNSGITKYYNDKLYSTCDINLCSSSITGSASTSASTPSCASIQTYSASINDSISTATSACYNGQTGSAHTKGIRKLISTKLSDNIETGRIEKGSYSNQKLTNIDTEFECWPFKTETIKLLPMSRKPITSNDLNKIYCSNCGRKLNQKYKYCPYCGAKVEDCPNSDYFITKCPYCGRNVRSTMSECPHCGEILN